MTNSSNKPDRIEREVGKWIVLINKGMGGDRSFLAFDREDVARAELEMYRPEDATLVRTDYVSWNS
jgi:hypothetical protein